MLSFFIIIFILSGLLGFGFVRQVRAISTNNPGTLTPASQINLILVRVDDLSLDRPGLTSVWGIFISRSVFPGLIMKRIYPEAGSPISTRLGTAFSVDRQKQLNQNFLDVMHALDLPSAEIVLVDDAGLADFIDILLTQTPGAVSFQPDPAITPDLDLFREVCSVIDEPVNSVPFVPEDVPQAGTESVSAVPFGYLYKWKGLVTSLHFASCEVLAGP